MKRITIFLAATALASTAAAELTFLASSGTDLYRVREDGTTEVFNTGLLIASLHRDAETGEVYAFGTPNNFSRRYYRVTNVESGTPELEEIGRTTRPMQGGTRANGMIYGISFNQGNTNFYSVDPTDFPEATAELIGNTGVSDALDGVPAHGLTYDDQSDTMYLLARRTGLYTVDLSTGAATLAAEVSQEFGVGGLSALDGTLYTIIGEESGPDPMRIGTVDPLTGDFELLHTIPKVGNRFGLVVVPEPTSAVLLLLGCGFVGRRARRAR